MEQALSCYLLVFDYLRYFDLELANLVITISVIVPARDSGKDMQQPTSDKQ